MYNSCDACAAHPDGYCSPCASREQLELHNAWLDMYGSNADYLLDNYGDEAES